EAAVVLERFGPVAACLVQLAQPLESRGAAVGVVDEVEEEAEHPRRGDDPLVYRQRGVGLSRLILRAGELEPAAARASVFVFVVPRAVSRDRVLGSTLGERDVRGGGMTERDAAAEAFANIAFKLGNQPFRLVKSTRAGVESRQV